MIDPESFAKHSPRYAFAFRPEGAMLSLPEQIADRICNAILAGEIGPGERIQEIPVATAFNVSRGPVREALRLLEKEGLVTFSPRRGAQVTELSIEEVEQLFDIRAALSVLAAQQAARNIDPTTLARLSGTVDAMVQGANGDLSATDYIALSSQAGQIVAGASGSAKLVDMIQSLSRQTLRYAQLGLMTEERRKQSSGLWAELVEAIRTGDAERAGEINSQTIRLSRDAAVRQLKEQRSTEGKTS